MIILFSFLALISLPAQWSTTTTRGDCLESRSPLVEKQSIAREKCMATAEAFKSLAQDTVEVAVENAIALLTAPFAF